MTYKTMSTLEETIKNACLPCFCFLLLSSHKKSFRYPPPAFHTHRQRAFVVQGTQVVEQLQSTHQRLRRRGIHEVKMNQVFHPQLQQSQHLFDLIQASMMTRTERRRDDRSHDHTEKNNPRGTDRGRQTERQRQPETARDGGRQRLRLGKRNREDQRQRERGWFCVYTYEKRVLFADRQIPWFQTIVVLEPRQR